MTATEILKSKCLSFAQKQADFLFLNSNQISSAMKLDSYEFIFMCGQLNTFEINHKNALESLADFIEQHKGKWMGLLLSYELKNEIEDLHSKNNDELEFPNLTVFVPEYILTVNKEDEIYCNDSFFLNEIEKENLFCVSKLPFLEFEANTSKEDYTKAILQTKNHILDGDVYELNYCIEFHKKNCPELDIVSVYLALNAASPTPFSALYANTSHAILCASPERFLLKIDNLIYSQPIKGTILRKEDKAEDELMKLSLLNSEKERAENLMIVDLVRNDLAKSAKTGSVQVEELFGIYSFKKLHQMISTVRAELNNTPVVDCIQNAFPMGSMTGAPKIKAMEIIDELEKCKRGMYSGSIGYISPNLDFDLNVVIRSLQYNSKKQYLSFQVGSAITIDSDAQAEYEECLLKGSAMMNLFSGAN
jgi:para-aminobenzoate synthetase component 1